MISEQLFDKFSLHIFCHALFVCPENYVKETILCFAERRCWCWGRRNFRSLCSTKQTNSLRTSKEWYTFVLGCHLQVTALLCNIILFAYWFKIPWRLKERIRLLTTCTSTFCQVAWGCPFLEHWSNLADAIVDVRRLTKQPKLTAIIQSRRLTLFGHIMCMDDNADAKRILLACSAPADWRRQPGRPRITWLSTIQQDLKHHHLTLPEAADLAQNRPLWRMMSTYGATQSWVACQKRRR